MSDTALISAINERVSELFGIYYAPSQRGNMIRLLGCAAREAGSGENVEDIHRLITDPKITENVLNILSHFVTIGETYFFREPVGFQFLTHTIIPAILADHSNNREIRIWSAGCSSGEEPYSIAMTLNEQLPDLKPCDISIFATDVNHKALEKARDGIYSQWSFRQTSDEMRSRYFLPSGKNFSIKPEIKQMVQFAHMNLVSESAASRSIKANSMDIIFCRNLLMYMSPEKINQVVGFLHQSLKMGGWLITSQVELNDIYFGVFQRVLFENGIFYKKVPPASSKKSIVGFMTPSSKETDEKLDNKPVTTNGPSRKPRNELNRVVRMTQTPDLSKRQPPDVDRLFNRAISTFKEHRYAACASICEQFIRKHGFRSEFVLLLVKTYSNTGDLQKAAEMMEKWLTPENNQAAHYHLYATILFEMGRLDKANQVLVKALYLDPGYLPAMLSRSQVLKQLGRDEMARKEITNLHHAIKDYRDDHSIPELDGMTAGRIREMLKFLLKE